MVTAPTLVSSCPGKCPVGLGLCKASRSDSHAFKWEGHETFIVMEMLMVGKVGQDL